MVHICILVFLQLFTGYLDLTPRCVSFLLNFFIFKKKTSWKREYATLLSVIYSGLEMKKLSSFDRGKKQQRVKPREKSWSLDSIESEKVKNRL